jgi:hypothetical protein
LKPTPGWYHEIGHGCILSNPYLHVYTFVKISSFNSTPTIHAVEAEWLNVLRMNEFIYGYISEISLHATDLVLLPLHT